MLVLFAFCGPTISKKVSKRCQKIIKSNNSDIRRDAACRFMSDELDSFYDGCISPKHSSNSSRRGAVSERGRKHVSVTFALFSVFWTPSPHQLSHKQNGDPALNIAFRVLSPIALPCLYHMCLAPCASFVRQNASAPPEIGNGGSEEGSRARGDKLPDNCSPLSVYLSP